MVATCGTCWREFPAGFGARTQHLNATGHTEPEFECDTCDRYFSSQGSVFQHMNATQHWNRKTHVCQYCNGAFYEKQDLHDHEVRQHYYCSPCSRYFSNLNNINAHLNSSAHRGGSIRCPFCGNAFTTATGLVHHLERGSCPQAPLDRTKMYEAVRRRDPHGALTKHLLEWHGDRSYEATDMTYNQQTGAYECYFCHRQFGSLHGLNQHLNSPVHQQNLYHCPNSLCRKEFTTLAAMVNHLESESCRFMRFNEVQTTAQRIIDPSRMIAF